MVGLNLLNERKLEEMLSGDAGLLEEIVENVPKKSSSESLHWFYRFIIRYLSSLDLSEKEAEKHYFGILEHKYFLSEKMDRDIGIRVAALDYFLNVSKILKNPKFIEIDFFEKLLKMSREDPKTGVLNFKAFKEILAREIKRAERYEQQLSVFVIDIDDFKQINDKYGHLFADKLLKQFIKIIQENIREEDIIARFGGDEFALLLPQTGRIGARCLAERIRFALIDFFKNKEYDGESLEMSFSGGLSTYPHDAKDCETLFETADNALYHAKFSGKKQIYDHLEKEYNENKKDRRRFKRFILASPSEVELTDQGSILKISGKIVNVSTTGFLMEYNWDINHDMIFKEFDVRLNRIGELNNLSWKLRGEIIRVQKEGSNSKFYMAMRFKNTLSQKEWKYFREYGHLTPLH